MNTGGDRHVPTQGEADRWEQFALLADKIGSGQSKDYRALRTQSEGLLKARVFGALTAENPCVRLRRIAAKAVYSQRPHEFHLSMRECAGHILRTYNEHYGRAA